MMKKGFSLIIDGSNGAGKSTIIKVLEDYFKEKNHPVVITREPGGTPIGEKIREVILNPDTPEMCDMTELMLFAAARAQHVKEKIVPALDAGKIVISDRFDAATKSFQHYARGLSLELINQLNDLALDGFKPDLNVILDLDSKIGLERVNSRNEGLDRMEMQKIEFLEKARNGYLQQAKDDPDHFEIIDASQSLEKVIEDVLEVVSQRVPSQN
jgi:dTMP kinase